MFDCGCWTRHYILTINGGDPIIDSNENFCLLYFHSRTTGSIIIVFWELFTPTPANVFPLESELKQVSSRHQDSSSYQADLNNAVLFIIYSFTVFHLSVSW